MVRNEETIRLCIYRWNSMPENNEWRARIINLSYTLMKHAEIVPILVI